MIQQGRRILFIIESPSMGGAEKVLVDIANALDSRKWDVTVCSIFKRSIYGKEHLFDVNNSLNQTVHYRFLSNNDCRPFFLLTNYCVARFPRLYYKLKISDKYDKVIAFYEGAPTSLVAHSHLKRGKKIAWIHTLTRLSLKGKDEKSIEEIAKAYSRFDRIVAVSECVAKSFADDFGSLSDKLVVTYNPIDIAKIPLKASISLTIDKPAVPLLVSVGRITGAKAYKRYLQVIRDLRDRGLNFQVWIIGGGSRSSLISYCEENKLDNVRFWDNQANPYPFMKMADWVVLPSRVEGLPTVILESLALGKAVIATDCGGPKEILGESEYGLLAGNDASALTQSLSNAIFHKDLQTRYEKTARQRAADFSLESCIPAIERILSEYCFDDLYHHPCL